MDAVDGQQCLMCLTDALIAFHVALLCPPFCPLTNWWFVPAVRRVQTLHAG